jgi:hypothetical protein
MQTFARSNAFVFAVVIAASALLPLSLLIGSADAAQLTNRRIDLSANQTSEGSGRDSGDAAGLDVTYRVAFTTATLGDLEGLVIDFCSNSPIVGDACTAPTGFNTNDSTLVLANQTGITGWAIDAASTANTLILTRTTSSVAASTAFTIDLGSTGGADGITNPSVNGTFYGRMITFEDAVDAQSYDSSNVNPNNPGASLDDGGVALAVANELTITARVQEVLQFCVGTTDAASTNDCNDISGVDINLGVVDSSTEQISDLDEGLAMIRTNAFNGAVIYYKAEQNNGSGSLKVAGATCSGVSTTDQCFNSAGTTASSIVAGTEEFGMTATAVNTTNSSAPTANLVRDAEYAGDGTAGSDWAWDDSGNFDTIASSSTVVDDEMLELAFAATASPTTPTGLYTVTANFVATATF